MAFIVASLGTVLGTIGGWVLVGGRMGPDAWKVRAPPPHDRYDLQSMRVVYIGGVLGFDGATS